MSARGGSRPPPRGRPNKVTKPASQGTTKPTPSRHSPQLPRRLKRNSHNSSSSSIIIIIIITNINNTIPTTLST
ncbi:hypothetical protein Cob_v008471 [Colletotrichum orbiculare MAFF 240422]|uniref:Uncharacterized protein n=1 Tax=Colletotrichum orbiculare (strain 104-T / ATCC 96160 / CBS 514.97 / LARS 414 / MAFF 240422) TaxID=1213857 RepID=A0A484FJC0_COLOR|nr:hypothetical protein Cob_v008471 [Colletotrichum orbiculare MAFF 240422]